MGVDLPDTEASELSSVDEPMEECPKKDPKEDQEEDLEEDIELGEPQANHGVEDAESSVFDSNFDSSEEPGDDFDLGYDPSKDH